LNAVVATAGQLPYSDVSSLAVTSVTLSIVTMVTATDDNTHSIAANIVQSVVTTAAHALDALVTAATASIDTTTTTNTVSNSGSISADMLQSISSTAAAVIVAVDATAGLCGSCDASRPLQLTFQKAVGLTGVSLVPGEPPFYIEMQNVR
jgi:hypothetical protein